MADTKVCGIKPLLYFCSLFGYYQDLHSSFGFRFLVKTYCLLVLAIATFMFYLCSSIYSWYLLLGSCTEHATIVVISLLIKNKYLLNYYKYTPFIDGTPISKNFVFLNRIITRYIPLVLLIEASLLLFLFYIQLGSERIGYIILSSSFSLATQLRRIPFMLIFLLFYYRVKTMRELLEANGFVSTPHRRLQPQRYIQMYESLMDGLEETTTYVQITLFIFLCSSMTTLILELFSIFENVQNSIVIVVISVVWIFIIHIIELQTLIVSAIASDLTKSNLQKMIVFVVEEQIYCKNERKRVEIQKFYQLMQTRPYEFPLSSIFPLELRSLLSIVSYLITTVIAVLQIKRLVS